MLVYDFEYDGEKLSDYGFMIGGFDGVQNNNVPVGSEITFNTVSILNGMKESLTSSEYDKVLETTIPIIKKPCEENVNNMELTVDEVRRIARWLNRVSYHKLKLIYMIKVGTDENNEDIYENIYKDLFWEGSFESIERIEIGARTIGLECQFVSNSPFTQYEEISSEHIGEEADWTLTVESESDAEGSFYPVFSIIVNEDGDLQITNDRTLITTEIKNCTNGEVITLNHPVIISSIPNHIYDDFNWEFPELVTTYHNHVNTYTVSLPCSITVSYKPFVKYGLM